MTRDLAGLAPDELVQHEPASPLELEFMIREIGDRLENAVPTLRRMWHDRYEAERELMNARATAILNSKARTVAEKRAEADLAAMPFRLAFDMKREALHGAIELQKALAAKLNALLNLNRANGAAAGIGRSS